MNTYYKLKNMYMGCTEDEWIKEKGWMVFNILENRYSFLRDSSNVEDYIMCGMERLLQYRHRNQNVDRDWEIYNGINWGIQRELTRETGENYILCSQRLQKIRKYIRERKNDLCLFGFSEEEMYNTIYNELKNKTNFKFSKDEFDRIWNIVSASFVRSIEDAEIEGVRYPAIDPNPTPEEYVVSKSTVEYIYNIVNNVDNELIRNLYLDYMQYVINGEEKHCIKKLEEKYQLSRYSVKKIINRMNQKIIESLGDVM